MKKTKQVSLVAATLCLASCQNWSSMIGLEPIFEGDELVFYDPNSTWLTTHCVTSIEVSRYEQSSETSWRQVEQMWEADSLRGKCLSGVPFKYGQLFEDADPERTTEAKPLQPGFRYELFIEQGGGAGQASFDIDQSGNLIVYD